MRMFRRLLTYSTLSLVLAACSGGGGGGGSTNSSGTPLPSAPSPLLTSVRVTATGGGSSSLVPGQTLQLVAAPKDQSGNALNATIAWTTSAPSVATVSSSGLVTGVAAGSANITALATLGSATASSVQTITVAAGSAFPLAATVNASGLSFSPATVDIAVGGTVTWSGLSSHDVTWDTGGVPGGDITGAASGARTFSVPAGSYACHCAIHGAGMSGTVVVH